MGIKVNRKDLYNILKLLAKAKKGRIVPDARITFSGNTVIFEYGGITSEISGEGKFSDVVMVKGKIFRYLYRLIPKTEEIEIGIKDKRIYFGNRRFSLEDENIQSSSIKNLPVNATKTDILRLIYQYTINEIKGAGYMPMYQKYEDEKLQRIQAAYEKLSEYGISLEELAVLVDRAIKEDK